MKTNLKRIKPSIRAKIITLRRKQDINLCDSELGNGFLATTKQQKQQQQKAGLHQN